jgi:uncharacterized membrane protein YfcA
VPRHDLDPVALLAGVAFLGVALGWVLNQAADAPARWVVPVLLIGIGLVGLIATRAHSPD